MKKSTLNSNLTKHPWEMQHQSQNLYIQFYTPRKVKRNSPLCKFFRHAYSVMKHLTKSNHNRFLLHLVNFPTELQIMCDVQSLSCFFGGTPVSLTLTSIIAYIVFIFNVAKWQKLSYFKHVFYVIEHILKNLLFHPI